MGIEGISPISGGQPSPIGPSFLIQQYKNLIQEYMNVWTDYSNSGNDTQLLQIFQKLQQFIAANKTQMENVCKNNGWSKGTGSGYDTNIDGSLNHIDLLLFSSPAGKGPGQPDLEMLNISLTSVLLMMTTKND